MRRVAIRPVSLLTPIFVNLISLCLGVTHGVCFVHVDKITSVKYWHLASKDMSGKGCWTCRERKVLCDRAIPICERCSRSKLPCQGYKLRLSWPKRADGRRWIIGNSPPCRKNMASGSRFHFVNSSFQDIQLYHYLLVAKSNEQAQLVPRIPPSPNAFQQFDQDGRESNLLQYFQHNASRFLATFGYDPRYVSGMLMRMALADDSPSATAILRSLLAFSSLHCYGHQAQVVELKISAVKALKSASRSLIGAKEGVRHIAATMVLCSIETCTSDQWTEYIRSVKYIIIAESLSSADRDGDFQILADWASYHESLGYFSVTHWSRDGPEHPTGNFCVAGLYARPDHLKAINLLEETYNAVSVKRSKQRSVEEQAEYLRYLRILEFNIRQTLLSNTAHESDTQLFTLALLVYLSRAISDILPELVNKTERHIEKAFSLFSSLEYCDRQFPLLVLGCEARNEEDRVVFLDLISRTQGRSQAAPLAQVETLVKASWAQSDLADHAGLAFDYIEKLNALISSCKVMPTFV
ncbi:fungal-specific transcription factor domain-containing protein [Nemania abortiva]|nr:fungal-specific transcription factor domain-containing protein [Nemania abortiva]